VRVRLEIASIADAPALATLRAATAAHLTATFGKGPWSSSGTVRGVLLELKRARVFVVREGDELIATLALSTRKPWAIDPAYFQKSARPLYLTSMAVVPARQRKGIGRACLEVARELAVAWPADAIRLDAYDAVAGAGEFYHRCGYKEVGRVTYRKTPLIYYEQTW
jgi:GNAT superfamily N-acetyltransferase